MPEPHRLESPALDQAGRDSRAETLLCEGLDQYFAGNYEAAIHIWTRVLFLDRTHSRARAYIDRARTAEAERLRHADELLDAGYELLAQGRTGAARRLLDDVVAERGDDERAAALRGKIDRVEQIERLATAASPARVPAQVAPAARPAPRWLTPARGVAGVAYALGALLIGALIVPRVTDWVGHRRPADELVVTGAARPWPVLSTSDVALVRARTAFTAGRLAEALQALERVSADSPAHAQADQLRVRIQQVLIGGILDRSQTEAGRR